MKYFFAILILLGIVLAPIGFVRVEDQPNEREIPQWAIDICEECVAMGGWAIVHIDKKTGEVTEIECEPLPEEFKKYLPKEYSF